MQFTTSAAAFLALISHVLAQTSGFDAITKPTSGEVLAAGSTFQVVWDYDSQYAGTVSITLLEGKTATTLELGDTVASGIDNSAGSYTWTVGSDLGDAATYGLKISLDSDPSTFQYSFPFKIEASDEGSSSSSAAAASIPASSPLSSSSSAAPASSTISPASSPSAPSSAAPTAAETSASEPAVTTEDKSATATTTTVASPTGADKTTAAKTTLTSVASATPTGSGSGSSTGSGTSSSPSAYVTAGAGKVVAGTFAAMGGLAVALFAL
ncbi:hypothetical protein VMCG_01570 [Cytospora schulzeri]|uniref:Yeast cell wall synthesis Kre9/Knh1-like N-terminal domain-containing protein n=1 Tax=Cytospora schulzeri TaxID=448051 RepID=A0A423X6H4_9PEZI|nr:hypothetical protein VMCG_01570 [Valsa malicola]